MLHMVLGDPLCTGHMILRMRSEILSLNNGRNVILAYNVAESSSKHPVGDKWWTHKFGSRISKMWTFCPLLW